MSASLSSARAPLVDRFPHLLAGGIAVLAYLGLAVGVQRVGRREVVSQAAALAPLMFPDKWRGRAAQLALFKHDDILPVYGSSELVVDMPYRASEFFGAYPTDFTVAPIGDRGFPPLSMAIALGSLGEDIRGKRLVVSLSGTWFLGDDSRNDRVTFRAHYSALQVGDVVFRSGLPIALRRRFAQLVRVYAEPGDISPFLATTLSCLDRRCAYEPLLPLLGPLWWIRSATLRAYNHAALAAKLHGMDVPRRYPRELDWRALEASGDSMWRTRSASNPFGIQDSIWFADHDRIVRGKDKVADSLFLGRIARAPKWAELELLLATLRALGARPLVLVTPLKGGFWDYKGVSTSARSQFYARLDSATRRFGFPTRTFQEYDGDPYFLSETRSHLSPKGWAVYDRTINAFYHDSIR